MAYVLSRYDPVAGGSQQAPLVSHFQNDVERARHIANEQIAGDFAGVRTAGAGADGPCGNETHIPHLAVGRREDVT